MYGIIIEGEVKDDIFIGEVKFNSLLNKGINPHITELSCKTNNETKKLFGKIFYKCENYWLHVWDK